MSIKTKAELKAYFETGDRPTQAQFEDLIDTLFQSKNYVALISQAGTDAPTATVLENGLGGTVVWTYLGVGQYLATLAGAFTSGKTALFIQKDNRGDTGGGPGVGTEKIIFYGSANTFYVFTYDDNGDAVDGILSNNSIEVRVYY